MLPKSPAESSSAYSAQVPLGVGPLKTESTALYGAAGAGAVKDGPASKALTWYESETICPDEGNGLGAASSKVRSTAETEEPAAASDIRRVEAPFGPTNRRLIS